MKKNLAGIGHRAGGADAGVRGWVKRPTNEPDGPGGRPIVTFLFPK